MKNIIIYLFVLMISNIYAQCDDYSQTQCSNDNSCEWVESIESVTCASLTWDEELCEASPDCNYSCDDGGGYFGWCEPSCYGGMTYIDNGYCQEIEMPECNEEYEFQCTDGSCIPIHRVCNNINDCEDGSDEIDCEDCSELLEFNCSNDDSCEWVDNTETGSCSSLSVEGYYAECDLPEYGSCYSDCTNWGNYYGGLFCYGTMYCAGGNYQIDNSYCEETEYQLGDLNQDSTINIQDVVIVIHLILDGEINLSADLNLDGSVDVLDVIQLVNIILN